MREVTPTNWFNLFAGNMKSRYGWDVTSADGFEPEKQIPVFVLRKSLAQLTAQKMGTAFKKAVIRYSKE